MDKELKAAVERLRRVDAGESAVSIYPDCYLKPPGYVGKWNACDAKESVKSSITQDRETLADAYLAEHPADDDEPVTEEWLLTVGFLPDEGSSGGLALKIWDRFTETSWGDSPAMQLLFADNGFWLDTYSQSGESLCLIELPPKETRGDVRRLCLALGVELKEMPE